MRFYCIKDEYIKYLKKFDLKICENKKETRPYLGVVLEIDGIKYYAPFSSPKLKHLKMKNSKDFRKIKNGELGVINFNNMIPVLDECLILIDINNIKDDKYKRLLQNQYKAINEEENKIKDIAAKLRKMILTDNDKLTSDDLRIKDRCCNLKLLENVYYKYIKYENEK